MSAYYVTGRSGGRTAVLAGPFSTPEAASRHEGAARDFLSRNMWRDTLGAFVSVGVTGVRIPLRRTPRFHAQITGEMGR